MNEPFDPARIGAAWDRAQADQENVDTPYDEHPDGWAIDWTLNQYGRDPELDWQVIEWIAENTKSRWSSVMLAAGPLENLISEHGESFIERIEGKARRSPRWRFILSGVWPQGRHNSEVWQRVLAAQAAGPNMDRDDPFPPA